MAEAAVDSPITKSLVVNLIFLNFIVDLPLELLRWTVGEHWGASEQVTGFVFDGAIGILLTPILTAMVLLVLHQRSRPHSQPHPAPHPAPRTGGSDTLPALTSALLENLGTSLRLWSSLLIVSFIISFILMGGTAIALLPGLLVNYLFKWDSPYALIPYGIIGATYVMVPLVYAQTLVVVESLSPWQARFRSRQLAKGHTPLLVAFILLMVLLPEGLSLFVEDVSKGAAAASQQLGTWGSWTTPETWEVLLRLILGAWWMGSILGSYHLYAKIKAKT